MNHHHLFLGTQQESMRDSANKNRLNTAFGEKSGRAKISEEIVKIIPQLYRRTDISTYILAREFNISQTNVRSVIHGKTWKHVI